MAAANGRAAELARAIEQFDRLDAVAGRVQAVARSAAERAPGAKDVLGGTWLGHPLHPLLTDVVVGAWTSALFLDLFGGRGGREGADRLLAAGIVAAVPTSAAGLADFSDLRGDSRRAGTVHAAGNAAALVLQALSLSARRRGNRRRGVALSTAAYGLAGASAWLGGHLSYGLGVGVNQTAFDELPGEWTAVLDESDVPEGKLVGADADGVGVLLVSRNGRIHALADRCSHRGCALHEGELHGDEIVCRCHGSTFALDGSLVKGPSVYPQPRLEVRTQDGRIEVRRPREDDRPNGAPVEVTARTSPEARAADAAGARG
jgi:nitrite reductase/ring-hydroxylating ferredoxin subunit/uncharacterized membrane protein